MTIERAISRTVYTQLVTTTSILAKLVVCAILLASIANAQAADAQAASNDGSNRDGVSRRSGLHAAHNRADAKLQPIRKTSHSNLSRLEREWKRLHSHQQVAMLRRLVACREFGQCEGLKIHPILGSALISVSPDDNAPVAAAPLAAAPVANKQSVSAARGAYAAASGKKPMASAHLRSKQPVASARIRTAAIRPAAADPNQMSPSLDGSGERGEWTFVRFPFNNQ